MAQGEKINEMHTWVVNGGSVSGYLNVQQMEGFLRMCIEEDMTKAQAVKLAIAESLEVRGYLPTGSADKLMQKSKGRKRL